MDKEKTALQELIPFITDENLREKAISLLEKEQQQLEETYQTGYDCGVQWLCMYKSGRDYYEKKFGNKK